LRRRRLSGWLAALSVLILGLALSIDGWDLGIPGAVPAAEGVSIALASAGIADGPTQLSAPSSTHTATPAPPPVASGTPAGGSTPTPAPVAAATPTPVSDPGGAPVVGSTPSPAPSPAPTPTPAPGITGLYGSAIGMDSLNNTQVGGPNHTSTSYRFRASTSARLNSVRVYIIGPTHAGYGAGTGGTWQVTVQTDNGASNHAPSGAVLASTAFKPVDGIVTVAWPSPASLTAGLLYHIVFVNVDADPTANYASVDGVFMFHPTVPRQPAFSNVNWGQPTRSGSGDWSDLSTTVPIMQLNYANGVTAGLGYMEVWVRSYKSISGSAMAREAFTVKGSNRSVSSFSVRLMRASGSSPLTVSLETSGGTLIAHCTIAASAIAIGTPGINGTQPTWEMCTFGSTQTLVAGQSYNVVLSTSSDTVYSIFVIRKGSAWGFAPTTYFSYGHAQYTTGSSWGPFTQDGGGAVDQADLQFYFG